MHFPASCACAFLVAFVYQVSSLDTITGLYGETVTVPCKIEVENPKDIFITKWKYDMEGGDLWVKTAGQNISITASDEYKGRVSMGENFSLLISAATLKDERTFICMVGAKHDIKETIIRVQILKAPSGVKISGKAEELEIGKLTKIAQCSAHDANPAASITWFKNRTPLVADGKGIVIAPSVTVDPDTGLSTTSSTLEYTAEKGDTDTQFTCGTKHTVGIEQVSSPVTFTITYPTEKVSLQVISKGPILEGGNVTLKCKADGNPPPTSFNFHIKEKVVKMENSDTYTLINVTREQTGEYRCSLIDNAKMEASENMTVNYLDMSLNPSGEVVKSAGEALDIALQTVASGELKVSWTKDNVNLERPPKFDKLAYSDSGLYECEVRTGALSQKASFKLVVEGAAFIRRLTKQRGEDGQHKVLVCEAEGSPQPIVFWSINGTSSEESHFVNGKITHKLTVVPTVNLTVSCTVSNQLGQDTKAINVSSLFEEVRMDKQDQSEDSQQTKLVVGIVVGLLLVTVVLGLAWWYMKKSKQGSWKTGEKENGSSEEEKKLEETSQKAEV